MKLKKLDLEDDHNFVVISKDKNNCIKLSFDIYQKTFKKTP